MTSKRLQFRFSVRRYPATRFLRNFFLTIYKYIIYKHTYVVSLYRLILKLYAKTCLYRVATFFWKKSTKSYIIKLILLKA